MKDEKEEAALDLFNYTFYYYWRKRKEDDEGKDEEIQDEKLQLVFFVRNQLIRRTYSKK